MRGIPAVLAFLALTASARAGIYSTIESTPDLPAEKIRSQVSQLRAVAIAPDGPLDPGSLRALYLKQAKELERERDNGTFSTVDCVNLSACYLRLGEVQKAIKLLRTCPDRNHFLIQLNLASAYFMSGDYVMALRHQETALDRWPAVWAGFKISKYDQPTWYRKCELLFVHLLRARLAESSRGFRGVVEVDPIFPALRFIGPGPGGAYEVGYVARDVREKLPSDAIGIALQFVLWYPQDSRLYWLLGELLNAYGHVQVASEIINELADQPLRFKDLREHRKVLERTIKLLNPGNQTLLLAALLSIPNGNLVPPGAGAAASSAANATSMAMSATPQKIDQPIGFPESATGTAPGSHADVQLAARHRWLRVRFSGRGATGFSMARMAATTDEPAAPRRGAGSRTVTQALAEGSRSCHGCVSRERCK